MSNIYTLIFRQTIFTVLLLFWSLISLFSQIEPRSSSDYTADYNFSCCPGVNLIIFNGLEGASGGQELSEALEWVKGAVTVTNLNDTDNDGIVDTTDINVEATDTTGRDEIDLMKIIISSTDDVPDSCLSNVTLEVKGDVLFWQDPKKITQQTDLTFLASSLPETLYIEVLSPSETIKDIEISAVVDDKVTDTVRATGVWMVKKRHWSERTVNPIVGLGANSDLKTCDETGTLKIVDLINNAWIALDSTRYGHGDCFTGQNSFFQNRRFGGRILIEFELIPRFSEVYLAVDITRRINQKTFVYKYGSFGASDPNSPNITEESFPDVAELPNDDKGNFDEDLNPDNDSSFIYSADIPSTRKDVDIDTSTAFKVAKTVFQEYGRIIIRPDSIPIDSFSFSDTSIVRESDRETVLGSRCSDNFNWHSIFYTRKNKLGELSIDSQSISVAFPRVFVNKGGNGFIDSISIDANSTLGSRWFLISYAIQTNQWQLQSPTLPPITQTISAEPDGSWIVNTQGLYLKIMPGSTAFGDDFAYEFNTFQTSSSNGKENFISEGTYNDFSP